MENKEKKKSRVLKRDWDTSPDSPYRKGDFDDHDIRQMKELAGLGLSHALIASVLGYSPATFNRQLAKDERARSAMDNGRGSAIAAVARTAYAQAVSGEDSRMTMFYLKTQAGWKETIDHDVKIDYQKLTDDELREVIKLTSEQYVALESAKEEDENEP